MIALVSCFDLEFGKFRHFNQIRTLDGQSQAHEQGVQLETHTEGGEGVDRRLARIPFINLLFSSTTVLSPF